MRTLHHYDDLGLLCPSERSPSGYRLYRPEDALRLQQILVWRELGLPLEAIRRILDDPSYDAKAALLEQRVRLEERTARSRAMLRAVDAALRALDKERVEPSDIQAIFDGFDPETHADEARHRWGDTDEYAQAAARTARYTKDDWRALRAEAAEVLDALAERMATGYESDSLAALDLAEQHRQHICRWFYACPPAMHAGLADLYEADPRFAANIDRHGDGLTPFLVAAIRANAARSR